MRSVADVAGKITLEQVPRFLPFVRPLVRSRLPRIRRQPFFDHSPENESVFLLDGETVTVRAGMIEPLPKFDGRVRLEA